MHNDNANANDNDVTCLTSSGVIRACSTNYGSINTARYC